MTDPTRVVLVRHGESNVTVARVIGGHRTCSGLSELGRQQAERLRARLAASGELAVDVVYASHFARAIETAEILAPVLRREVRIEAGFGEHDPGPDIDGMTFDAYVERFGAPDWDGDPDTVVFPGGETTAQFHRRVVSTMARIVDEHPGRTLLVSCHGGVVDAVLRWVLGAPMTGGFEVHTVNTSITEVERTTAGRWRLRRYNDAAHLAGLDAATPRRT